MEAANNPAPKRNKRGRERVRGPRPTKSDGILPNQPKEQQEEVIVSEKKKPYASFLMERPFESDTSQAQKEEEATVTLMNCLRYRLRFALKSNDTELNSENLFDCIESNQISESSCRSRSLYDTLLQLINEFDATGAVEIFRLLLERRTAIPLFIPDFKKHHLNLLRHVSLPGIDDVRLGEDKSLLRVVVISCRQRCESQTGEILKNLFNIESLHRHDLSTGSVSSSPLLAEIGYGCLVMEGSGTGRIQHVLVIHVIGDFKLLWLFLQRFADYLLIEDSSVEKESLCPTFLIKEDDLETTTENSALGLDAFPFVCVWKPSFGEMRYKMKRVNESQHHRLRIEGQLPGKTLNTLRSSVSAAIKAIKDQCQTITEKRPMLHEIPILEDERYSALECVSPAEIQSSIAQSVRNLGEMKTKEFLLQKNFRQQAKHEEAKMEHRMDKDKLREDDAEIKKCIERRRADSYHVQNNSLLSFFLSLLTNKDPCSRVLSLRVLEKELAERGERELVPLLKKISNLKCLAEESSGMSQKELDSAKGELCLAKTNLIDSVLNVEHLWRELSHLYTAMEPESRWPVIQEIPRLAAQHLLDGFSLELLDGDSNMIHMEWVTEVLHELSALIGDLNRKRIFVLSVMGVQSSGKSTLLNTMFGIQMRTSVGQCTRGVNMQLLAVEGRPEYDYILLLDTEGTRAPEYHGLPGSEKRDNQMATLSILLADATIVVTPGENDAAIKEILPIVLLAYQGSKLAEDNGGRLSSRMFFVYNRIDTKQKNKLDNIIQTLGTSLHDAFSQVQKLTGNLSNLKSESPFGNFNLETSNSSGGNDVCILGNVKKEYEPPGDVPDAAYGEALIQLREHIHRRVVVNNENGQTWKSRSIDEFSRYIEEVWKCIGSANFNFNFATVVERITFDQMESEYKKVEQKLAEAYLQSFANIKKKMIEEKGKTISSTSPIDEKSNENRLASFEAQLRDQVMPTEQHLDVEVKEIVKGKGREKWSLQYQELWKMNKIDQERNWKLSLKTSFNTLFNYEHHVDNYKKKMRKEINELFKSTNLNVSKWTENDKHNKFNEMFDRILNEVRQHFPPKDISAEIMKVYQNSNVIKKRQIEIGVVGDGQARNNFGTILVYENERPAMSGDSNPSLLGKMGKKFSQLFYSKTNENKKKKNPIDSCYESVHTIVNRIAAGKMCYDDTIVYNVISDVDAVITSNNISAYTDVQYMHDYGRTLIIELMQNIEKQWEAENSVFAKLEANKERMREYFVMVSQGVEKTKLFVATMENTLENVIVSAFREEIVLKTFKETRNERWLYDARFMQKHMDLYLIDLLQEKEIDKVLDFIKKPQRFYKIVLHRLVAKKVPEVDEEWKCFVHHLKGAIEKAAKAFLEVDNISGKAQVFVGQLRNEFLHGYLQSERLASEFLIDCGDEFQDCDKEEKKTFLEACTTKLIQVVEKQKSPPRQRDFAKRLSPKVVQYMKTLNDPAALPRCDACCTMCMSLCIEAANHDTKFTPHDAIHQPGGVSGLHGKKSRELVSETCSQSYELDKTFQLSKEAESVIYKYRDYAKVFPGWKDPRINEELPLREYILATHNEDIAKKYDLKPCINIPAKYFRNLSTIKKQLERDIQN